MTHPAPARRRIPVLLVTTAVLATAACTSPGTHRDDGSITVDVTRGACGGAWQARAGVQAFAVHNADIVTTDVDLVDPRSGGVYAQIEPLAPATTRPMRVLLGAGSYAFRCFPDDATMLTGPTTQITGGPAGSPAILPLNDIDLLPAVKTYRAGVTVGLATLAAKAAALDTTLHHGTLAQARAAWLDAHLAYSRLGAAYGTFGDFADAIDGTPAGLPGGVNDPDFTGFHRIEYGLWHGEPLPSLAPRGDKLVADVAALRADFPKEQTDPNDLPLRAHEIMENALEFELTGTADEGSGTSLATAIANLDGTQQVLDAIAPLVSTRYAGWSRIAPAMATARAALSAARRPDGAWTPVAALAPGTARRIDAAVSGLLETLAPIAEIGEVRRTS